MFQQRRLICDVLTLYLHFLYKNLLNKQVNFLSSCQKDSFGELDSGSNLLFILRFRN
jgi:hypothetical protein